MTFGGGGSSAPPPPQWIPTPAAPSYVAPPDPQGVVPEALSAKGVIKQGNYVEGFTTTNKKGKEVGLDQVPENLRLNKDPLSHEVRAPYEQNFYQQYINPQLAAAKAATSNAGQSYSSYGGARIGQLEAQGQLSKFQAGLEASQQVYNNLLAGRQSYFAGGPRIVQEQNALDVQRGLGVAGLQSQNYDSQNRFNLGVYGIGSGNTIAQNQFNQGNYRTGLEQSRYQDSIAGQGLFGIGGGLLNLASGFGGGGGGGSAFGPSTAGNAFSGGFSLPGLYNQTPLLGYGTQIY